ncbi:MULTISPECIES: xanthine dehydrogenase family protein molybdopterin-binding subunit [unclassified Spirosoma]|uniref:xanthine dehydrogenase family protein molybdopterin-binding subunit n=1 Tax=unclassified Spirosoma TaxID=2621999 RepID=UPI000964DADF|nr:MULTISPECIES: xanthine dehydrogenase family protein molybdopterin-binding subunit [unclassified Spirosoma]MBN8824350.1 xanthine dehydrogenase family protein molybdopterin-binding subunit [Spirosoma sp.]OJW70184.1 MAG: aldehyde oxidase [Spirosoma sp. 48-14]
MSQVIGKPINRVDGRDKVTGKAKYAAEFQVPDLAYGYVVSGTITKGKITRIDTSEALRLDGVLQVFTHENRPKLAWFDISYKDQDAPPGSPFRPLQDATIKYSGQPIALVVAETFEVARYAASLIRVEYKEESHETSLEANLHRARPQKHGVADLLKPPPPKPRGDFNKVYEESPVKMYGRYIHAAEHHNPMELFASTVVYEKGGKEPKLTIYDKTQGVTNSILYVSQVFDIPFKNIRVLSPYMGGGFGSGLRPQYQLFMAVMASLELKRSVRVTLTRQQMFTFGHRPATVQNVALSATADGAMNALYHDARGETSRFEDYTEIVTNWGGMIYPPENVTQDYKLVPLDVYTPLDMRAPGGVTGMSALEIAVDELAYELGMDPLELRLKNYTDLDHNTKKPFSSKELRECFRQGAERFGWSKRQFEPRSMKKGHNLIGWGMATGIWEANQMPARAEAALLVNGKLWVSSATADIGTGTYTIMTQIAADTLGVPVEDVLFKLGDTDFPVAPISGGSWTAATVGMAVHSACEAVGKSLLGLAKKLSGSPFKGAKWDDIEFADKQLRLKSDPSTAVSLQTLVDLNGGKAVRETSTGLPNALKQKDYARATHSAAFVEVMVDEELGTVKVTRAVSAIAAGRILNPKTARSQILGGMVWGISKALHEESILDHNIGRFMNHNLAEYHVSVNADIHDLDVIFVEEDDTIVNPLGIKGLGEIGIVAMPAAIANAIFHATGKRVRDLPITLDRLL